MRLINKLFFAVSYFVLWIVYFILARCIFLIYNYDKVHELDFITVLETFFYGFKLDISAAGYLCLLPLLFIILFIKHPKLTIYSISTYTCVILLLMNFLMLIDAALYQFWGARIDTVLFNYANTPLIMIASISKIQIIVSLLIWSCSSLCLFYIYKSVLNRFIYHLRRKCRFREIPIFTLLIIFLIIPIRGGTQYIPITQSDAYFSSNTFANQSAINFAWNFSHAVINSTDTKNPYKIFNTETAKSIIDSHHTPLLDYSTDTILKIAKPNVILLIWEGLSSKVVGVLGGEANVTKNINHLSTEGILFTNFYSNGDRTDKALISILSGYYPQTNKSIMKYPKKTMSLPTLTEKMEKLGYDTAFYYGGDTNFANMKSFLFNNSFNYIFDRDNLKNTLKDTNNETAWGIHDHIVLDYFRNDFFVKQKEPFFGVVLTLTSHVPYHIPTEYKFGKNNLENKYKSSQAYTDEAIGEFIRKAKKETWWNNTLIIIMADHGNPLPRHKGYINSPKKFHIPMLWLGGALNKTNIRVTNIGSQVDFAYTLLHLLKGDKTAFTFGKNIFNVSDNQYAHYIFNNGFGTLSKSGLFIYDYVNKTSITKKGDFLKLEKLGKALTQVSYEDFINR